MVEYFSDLASIEFEVGVSEVAEADYADEDEEVGVVALALRFERIIA